ncbi:MAG: InlB B-repeat-containing protein, partial [Parasporobacterium sp.]|nr:InlB B-repeat-containing protein [Parasporobacterium sp.]
AATAPGYTFSGWDRQGTFTMPAEDVVIKGSFTANTDTPYTVKHYTENLDGTYTLADVENLTGTTDTTVQATPKSYTGFTFDNTVAGTVESGTIAGDGSLELILYYTRNTYTVTYKYDGTVPAGASALPAVASHKYGELVTVAPAATAPGYTFSGWDRQGAFNMPAANVEIKGSFTAKLDTPYKVEHYLQNLDNNDFTKYAVQDFQGTTGTTAYATPNSYTGFTFDSSVAGTVMSGTIAGDGSLVLKLYYTRNSYKVTYEYVGTVPAGASALPAEKTYKYDELVMIAPKATATAGYDFIGWNRTANFKMPAENVTIQGTFVARGDTPYTVEHYQQNLDGTGYNLVDTENLTGQTDAQAAAVPKAYTGFTFDSTVPGTIQTGTITGDGKLVLKLYYTRNAYNVVIHYVDIAGNTLAPDAVLTGIKVGQTFADIISPTIAGYTARNGFIRCPAGG